MEKTLVAGWRFRGDPILVGKADTLSRSGKTGFPGYRRTVIPVLSGRSEGKMLAVGFFMGLLPCGLSFAAFARALSAGGPMQGGLLVLFFGLGTVPGLLLVGAGASRIFNKFRRYSDPLSGMLMIGMAASLMADVIGAIAG